MFQLTAAEWAVLRSRIVIPTSSRGGRRFAQLETRLDKKLTEHDEAIATILSAIRELMNPLAPKHRPIGFTADLKE